MRRTLDIGRPVAFAAVMAVDKDSTFYAGRVSRRETKSARL